MKLWVLCLCFKAGWFYVLAEDIKAASTEMLPESVTCLIPDVWLNNLLVPSGVVVHKQMIFFLLFSSPLASLGLSALVLLSLVTDRPCCLTALPQGSLLSQPSTLFLSLQKLCLA